MAYDREHMRISWIFTITGTTEVAETSLNVSSLIAPGYDAVDAVAAMDSTDADTLSGLLVGMINSSDFLWADYSTYVALKVAPVGIDGHYLADARVFPFPGHTGTHNNVPPQDSLVLSLRSGSVFGEANFGRMYLPHTMAALGPNDARMTIPKAGALAAAFAIFIGNVNSIVAAEVPLSGVVIMSAKGSGTTKAPAQAGSGRVIDTQRRRRNRLDEDTQLVTI